MTAPAPESPQHRSKRATSTTTSNERHGRMKGEQVSNDIVDLYVVGKEYTLPGARPVKVWLQKLNDVDHDLAVKKARAAQAKVKAALRITDGEDYLAVVGQAESLPIDDATMFGQSIMSLLMAEPLDRAKRAEDAKLALEPEWADDDYLEGLRRSWREGLQATFIDTAGEDEDAKRVYDELARFRTTVDENVTGAVADERRRLEAMNEDDLRDLAVPILCKQAGNEAWYGEYRRCVVWRGVRVCTHDEHKYPTFHRDLRFPNRPDVDVLQTPTFLQLILAMEELTVDVVEGKDSAETPDSSSSSESHEQPETAVSSGLAAAAQ